MKYIKVKRIFESELFKETPRIIKGDFDCYNKNLSSLMGGPEQIIKGGSFKCGYNNLINLDGAPIVVDKNFICTNNKLISLKGSPKHLKGEFDCSANELRTLDGAPIKVGTTFWALNNNLISLEGGPIEVGKDYHVNDKTLVNLKGLPHYLRGKLFLPLHIELSKEDLYNKSKLKTETELLDWMKINFEKRDQFIYIKHMFSSQFIKKHAHLFISGEFGIFKST